MTREELLVIIEKIKNSTRELIENENATGINSKNKTEPVETD